jgi:hypothetical protein
MVFGSFLFPFFGDMDKDAIAQGIDLRSIKQKGCQKRNKWRSDLTNWNYKEIG